MSELSESARAWWIRPGADAGEEAEDPHAWERLHTIMTLLERTQSRKRGLLLFGAMYAGGLPPTGNGTSVDTYARSLGGTGDLTLNVTRNVVDAVVSRVFSKSKPKVAYVTEGGDYERQHNAQQLEAGVDGVFYTEKAHPLFITAGRDACVFDRGILCIEPDFDERRVRFTRDFSWENIHDDTEAVYGQPMSLYRYKYIDKFRLIHLVREGFMADGTDEERAAKARIVERLDAVRDSDSMVGYQQVGIRVRVEQGWRKPSSPGKNDGRYVVGVAGCTLIDRPWGEEGDRWPFATFCWSEALLGFRGQGLVELGAPIQGAINRTVRQIDKGLHLITGRWLVNVGAKVRRSHINNDLGAILEYAGDPSMAPQYQVPSVIAPETYQYLWQLSAKYYELAGVNQQSASAQKPAGLDSGEAQRVYADQQTETLLEKGERYQQFILDCASLTAHAAKELAATAAYEVRSENDEGFDTINWKDIAEPDGYECRMAPISSLPGTPAAKIQLAYDLMKVGDFDAADVMEVIGMPDVLQKTKMKQSSRKLVEKKVGQMLRDGTQYEAHAMLNIPEAIIIATQMYCLAESKDVADDRLQVVRDFIDSCKTQLKAAQPPPAPMLAPGAGQGPMLGPGQAGVAPPGGAPPGPPPPPAQAA